MASGGICNSYSYIVTKGAALDGRDSLFDASSVLCKVGDAHPTVAVLTLKDYLTIR